MSRFTEPGQRPIPIRRAPEGFIGEAERKAVRGRSEAGRRRFLRDAMLAAGAGASGLAAAGAGAARAASEPAGDPLVVLERGVDPVPVDQPHELLAQARHVTGGDLGGGAHPLAAARPGPQ